MSEPEYPCTECGGDAFIGYGSDKEDCWQGKVKKGERLCTQCFQKRGGINFFAPVPGAAKAGALAGGAEDF
jgi:hypothetical protein